MNAPAHVSVVVPFFNSERHIRACLESLSNQEQVEGPYELIFVNNGSTDASASIVAEYDRLTVLDERRPGAYAARNTGVTHATAPLIAFTDADCAVASTWLRSIQEAMLDPGVAILIGRCQFPPNATATLRSLGAYENAKAEYVIDHCARSRHFGYANNMAVRASLFDDLGPFKEWQRAADSEFIHRLAARRPHLRVAYNHAMRIRHLEFLRARDRLRRLSLYSQTNAKISTFRELRLADRVGILAQLVRQRWNA